jgi:hypothetical protein
MFIKYLNLIKLVKAIFEKIASLPWGSSGWPLNLDLEFLYSPLTDLRQVKLK